MALRNLIFHISFYLFSVNCAFLAVIYFAFAASFDCQFREFRTLRSATRWRCPLDPCKPLKRLDLNFAFFASLRFILLRKGSYNAYYKQHDDHYGKNVGHITFHKLLHFQTLALVGFAEVIIPAPAFFRGTEKYCHERT